MTNEELAIRIKAGIDVPENMLQLWEQTKAFIHTVAMRYQGYADIEDLEQEGYLALYDAVDGFQPEKGYKFLTYAGYWICRRMNGYINNCCRPVRIPAHARGKINDYNKMVNAFQMCLGRMPTEWEISYNLNLKYGQMEGLEDAIRMSQVGSLDSALKEGEDGDTLGDMVACDANVEKDVLDAIERQEMACILHDAVDSLPADQAEAIRLRYMEGLTLEETGKAMGMPASRARSIEFKALRELRWGGRLDALLPEQLEAEAYRHNGAREFNTTWESSTERVALKLAEKRH